MKKIIKKIISESNNKLYSKILYYTYFNKKLDLKNPKDFNEKLMYLKIKNYNKNRTVWQCSDKYLMRQYAIEKGVKKKNLVKLLKVYNNADEIDFCKLPDKFVLKCTHGCGFNIICNDKNKIDEKETIQLLKKWQKTKFGYESGEIHYTHTKPHIICEEYIESNKGFPYDYKIYCFYGEPYVVLVCSEREKSLKLNYFDLDWNEVKYSKNEYRNNKLINKPKTLDKMIEISKKVSKEFPFVRVDFYEYNNEPILGEMTFTPAACLARYYSELGNKELACKIKLEKKNEK